jgi:hypothetical protein
MDRSYNHLVVENYAEGEVKLLRLQDGDAPVLLESFREEGVVDSYSIHSPT